MAAKKSAKKPVAKSRAAKKPSKPTKASKASKPAPRRATKPKAAPRGASKSKAGGAKKRPQLKSRRPSLRPKRPVKAKAAPKPASSYPENPEALALARTIAHVAAEKKATDVLIIDTRARGSAVGYDYVVIASGDSERQLEAISSAVDDVLKPKGTKAASVEASADWVLANYHDVVAHFFTPDTRGIYDLEGLWSDAPRVPLK
jgi:ribosome-associated protein